MAESACGVINSNNKNTQNQVNLLVQNSIDAGDAEQKTETVGMEPLLLEDYTFDKEPRTLSNILHWYTTQSDDVDRNDILAGMIYLLMLESGFVPLNDTHQTGPDCAFNYQRVLKLSTSLPDNWKQKHEYHFDFVLSPVPQFICSIIAIVIAEDFLINCTVRCVSDQSRMPKIYTLLLDPLLYFISSNLRIDSIKFQDLNQLSRRFKDTIAFPAKCEILESSDVPCMCLVHLPQEILLRLLQYFRLKDIVNFSETCSFFYYFVQDPKWWQRRLFFDFKFKCGMRPYNDIKSTYINHYKRKKVLRKYSIRGGRLNLV